MDRGALVGKWPAAIQLLIVGFYVAFSLLIPTLMGLFWLGPKFGHKILFALIGLGAGTAIMAYGVYRMVRPFLEEAKREGKEEQIRRPIRTLINLSSSKQKKNKEQE
jgi:hypothetical protein